ncbi:hypothetical protein AB0C19_17480 [Micromonospora sp. NPDC048842]|uniref:hypothetical protein n=1 Tax=Micromonospora sp. NPDC048842 TaxID=3154346 RepID=UPI0033CD646F
MPEHLFQLARHSSSLQVVLLREARRHLRQFQHSPEQARKPSPTSRLAADSHPHADFAARVGEAAGVDTAVRAVADLAPLIGAAGIQRAHPIAKARADLTGLLYVDGIHDSLYRSGGCTLLTGPVAEVAAIRPGTAAADRYDEAARTARQRAPS